MKMNDEKLMEIRKNGLKKHATQKTKWHQFIFIFDKEIYIVLNSIKTKTEQSQIRKETQYFMHYCEWVRAVFVLKKKKRLS